MNTTVVIITMTLIVTTLFCVLIYYINMKSKHFVYSKITPGTIVAFYPTDGLYTSIPDGWLLCDGTHKTPDLRNRFIMGAFKDSNNEIGTLLGSSAITIETEHLPNHSHLYNKTQNAIAGLPNEKFLPVNFSTFRRMNIKTYKDIYNKDSTYYTGGTSNEQTDGLIINQDPNYMEVNGISNLFPPNHKALNLMTHKTVDAQETETLNTPLSIIPPSTYLLYIMKT